MIEGTMRSGEEGPGPKGKPGPGPKGKPGPGPGPKGKPGPGPGPGPKGKPGPGPGPKGKPGPGPGPKGKPGPGPGPRPKGRLGPNPTREEIGDERCEAYMKSRRGSLEKRRSGWVTEAWRAARERNKFIEKQGEPMKGPIGDFGVSRLPGAYAKGLR